MNINLISINDLKLAWRSLYTKVKSEKTLDLTAFNSAFVQTFSILSEYADENHIDKRYMEVLAEAFLFARIEGGDYDSNCVAAFVLTERLLKHTAFNKTKNAEVSTIYFAELRTEIELDFNNVKETVDKLAKIFDQTADC